VRGGHGTGQGDGQILALGGQSGVLSSSVSEYQRWPTVLLHTLQHSQTGPHDGYQSDTGRGKNLRGVAISDWRRVLSISW
jgi:hypothetical protein